MRDERDEKLDTLFAAARSEHCDTSALEAHFETRLMARLAERKAQALPWHLMVWRLVPAFAVIAAVCVVCSFYFNPVQSGDVFAAITSAQEESLYANVLSGE